MYPGTITVITVRYPEKSGEHQIGAEMSHDKIVFSLKKENKYMIEQIIKDLIADNEENNIEPIVSDEYGKGYYEGYHDALVDLMNKLRIKHNEEIYNN